MQTWLEESRKACNRSWYQLPELLPKEQGSAPLQGWLTGQFLGSSAWRLLWVFCNLSRNVRVLLQHPHSCPQAVLRQNLASSNESTLFSSYKRQKQEPIASSLVGDRMRFHSSVLRPQAKARKARLPSLWGNRRGWPLAGGGDPPLAGVTEQHTGRTIPARRPRGERSGNLSSSLAEARTSLSDITGRGQRRRLRLTKCNCLLGSPSRGFSAERVM